MTVAGMSCLQKMTLPDTHVARGDHIGAEIGVATAITGPRIGDRPARVVVVDHRRVAGFMRPAADLVLPVPMVILAGPDHECHIPTVTRAERSGEIRTGMQAIADRGRLHARAAKP